MARDGMSNLIMRLRRLVDDSESAVWLDGELQDVLDEHSTPVYREQLAREKTRTSSTSYEYKIFHSRNGNYEPIFRSRTARVSNVAPLITVWTISAAS